MIECHNVRIGLSLSSIQSKYKCNLWLSMWSLSKVFGIQFLGYRPIRLIKKLTRARIYPPVSFSHCFIFYPIHCLLENYNWFKITLFTVLHRCETAYSCICLLGNNTHTQNKYNTKCEWKWTLWTKAPDDNIHGIRRGGKSGGNGEKKHPNSGRKNENESEQHGKLNWREMEMKEHSFACIHSTNFSLYHFDSRPNIYSITTRCSQVTFA